MQFFRDSKIQFMRYRRIFVVVSAIFILIGIFAIFVHGRLNIGIDFAGGTQLTLKFKQDPEIDQLRQAVASRGLREVVIQSLGETGSGEAMIKAPISEGSEEGNRDAIVAALDESFNSGVTGLDLNRVGVDAIEEFLLERDPMNLRAGGEETAAETYRQTAEMVRGVRQRQGLIRDWSDLETAGVDPAAVTALRGATGLGEFSILGAGNVGPQIGAELRQKGILAVVFSLLGMLVYIWFRFELRYGIGALVAVVHDVLITLGLFALTGLEFNLTTVAGFLTLVGYSVNDSVVVFDRVRENLRRSRSRSLEDTMNLSLNQTLSRTVLTSGTTLLALGCLLVFGGDVLRGFAFILTVGIVVGTYSSIYVASPFALLWEEIFSRRARSSRREAKAST